MKLWDIPILIVMSLLIYYLDKRFFNMIDGMGRYIDTKAHVYKNGKEVKQQPKNTSKKKKNILKKLLSLFCVSLFFIFHFSFFNSAHAQCPQALMEYASRYTAAEPQDLYKLVFQDLYGPGHLITDSTDCYRYVSYEVEHQCVNEITTFPLYEYTLCDSNFVRVNLYLVKWGVISLEQMVSAVMRSAEGMPTPDPKFVQTHSAAFKATYDPHYRIVRRDIFEQEILPKLEKWEMTNDK